MIRTLVVCGVLLCGTVGTAFGDARAACRALCRCACAPSPGAPSCAGADARDARRRCRARCRVGVARCRLAFDRPTCRAALREEVGFCRSGAPALDGSDIRAFWCGAERQAACARGPGGLRLPL